MKLVALLASLSFAAVSGFVPAFRPAVLPRTTIAAKPASLALTRPSARAAVPALSAVAPGEEYWEGDWVCADCGYIYDADDCNDVRFEDQPRGFVCPQCRGPRRRFAKKVGDKIGVTLDGGDGPILFFSFAGLAATVAFAFWFVGQ